MNSKPYIILIDGPKGSGKTSVWELLKEKLPDVEFLSLDEERRKIPNARATDDFNNQAFEIIYEKIKEALGRKKSVLLDAGVKPERIERIDQIAQTFEVPILKFALIAPQDVLLSRIRDRDMKKGKATDEERFWYTYHAQQSKDFKDFIIFDTSKIFSEEIASKIYAEIL